MQNLNTIICGDNLPVLKKMTDLRGHIDLIYLDPPFTRELIGVDKDYWNDASSTDKFLRILRPRINLMYDLLAKTGSFYCHSDWRMVADFQDLLDEIFGKENLIAKIIWQRSRTSSIDKFIPHTYEVILFYGKSLEVNYFPQYASYSTEEIDSLYKYTESETGRRYRLVNLTRSNVVSPELTYEFLGVKRTWRFTKEKMEEEFKQGRIVQSKSGAVPMWKQYINEGKLIGDVWTDINLADVAKEKTGYPTQKPLALLQRILKMSTEEGDIVLDPFCGSGTTLAAAEMLGRKWIGIDISSTACEIAAERILSQKKGTRTSDILQLHGQRTLREIRNLPAYEFEDWVVSSLKKLLKGDTDFIKSKGLESWRDADVYSITSGTQLKLDLGMDIQLQGIPVMVKQKDKVEAREIANFALQLNHHKQNKGFYVALGFSKSALNEATNQQEEDLDIILISAKDLLKN